MASAIATQGNRRQPAYCSTQKWRRPAGSHKETATNQRRPQSAQPTKSPDMTDKEGIAQQRPHTATEFRSSTTWGESCMNQNDEEKEEDFDEDNFLVKKFLDSEYSIRDDVHIKFKRFPWLCGEYGIIGPNENIPRTHFYLTVKNEENKSKILAALNAEFGCEPHKYFELLQEPKTPAKFKYLADPTPGGGILAVDRESGDIRASGTLTMFCFQNKNHYALTCFHICIPPHLLPNWDEALNLQEFLNLRNQQTFESLREHARDTHKYCYRESEIDDADNNENIAGLGHFSEGSYNSDADIMSIEVSGDVQIECEVAEIGSPAWVGIWRELHERVVNKRGKFPVMVKKVGYSSNVTHGYIDKINWSVKYQDELLYKNAIVIRSDSGTFLRPGDSGSLVYFVDAENKQQPFAYGVGAKVNGDADGNESDFICLKLNTALKNLELPEAGCFRDCSSKK